MSAATKATLAARIADIRSGKAFPHAPNVRRIRGTLSLRF